MKIIKEKYKFDGKLNIYWGRIYFISDNKEWKSRVLWYATYEYLRQRLRIEKMNDRELDHFANIVVNKWKKLKNGIFRKEAYYDVYKLDAEADGGLDYLRDKDRT